MSVQSSFSAGSQGWCGPGQLGVCWKQEMGRAAAPPHLAGGLLQVPGGRVRAVLSSRPARKHFTSS